MLYDAELWKTSGHWDKYRENMFFTEVEERADGAQADELPRPLPALRAASAAPTATCRSATPSRGLLHRHEPSRRRCTACCASATSPRTTPTSSAPRSRSQDEVDRLPRLRLRRSTTLFGFDVAARALDPAREAHRRATRCGTTPRRRCAQALERRGPGVRGQRGRRRLLRPEDRPAHDRLARPLVAARHGAARLQDAGALRPRRTPAPTTPSTGR